MARAIIALFGIILLGAVLVPGLSAALEDAGDDRVVINETWTPDAGNVTQLDNSGQTGAYYGNETTVYNATDAEMDRGTDYVWYETNGTVQAVVGGQLEGATEATISYTYQQTTSEQRALAQIPAQIPRLVGVLIPVFGFVMVLFFLKG